MPIAEEQKQVYDYDSLCLYIMSGFAVLLCDGAGFGIAIGIQGFAHRSVDEPSTHINLRASREGFIEVVRTNVAMVRRRMKSPTLKTIMMTVGGTQQDRCFGLLSYRQGGYEYRKRRDG